VISTRDGVRARRRARAAITTAAAMGVIATTGALSPVASAAFVEPPQMPHAPTVFPDRDFVSAEGYANNKDMRITVLRNGVPIGQATGTTDNAGLIEVNHPGGVCWSGTTPNIIAGDKIVIAEAGDPADTGDAVTVSNVTADAAVKETDALGDPTGRVIVTGRALNADGSPMDLGLVEQRVVNPDLKDTAVGKRDVRAVVGEGLSADPSVAGGFIAVYDQYPDDIDDLIVNGQTRVLTWQATNAAGDRLGITIHEVGEVGGPGFGGCPGGSDYAVTGANHPAVTKAMKDTGASLVVQGVAQDASAIDVTLTDGVTSTPPVVAATTDSPSGAQTWRAEFTAAQLDALRDGTLTASAVYTLGSGTVSGGSRTFAKDTIAPDAPQATPGSGTYTSSQAVVFHTTDPAAKVHFAVGGGSASAASPVAPVQLAITSSQTVSAIAVDPVGNTSGVARFDYTIHAAPPIVQVIPGAGATAPPASQVLAAQSASLAVSRLTLARRISVTRLRAHGLRTSMRVPDGANVVRIAIYRSRNGQRTGRALYATTRAVRAGMLRVTVRNRRVLSKLRPGTYVMEARSGRSLDSLDAVRRITFTVTQ
jgi:Chitobiase/beta-hexosaminidase C-terminal domain